MQRLFCLGVMVVVVKEEKQASVVEEGENSEGLQEGINVMS